jgi:hypothetical protein
LTSKIQQAEMAEVESKLMQSPGTQAYEARNDLMNNRKLLEILKRQSNKAKSQNLKGYTFDQYIFKCL